jgi:hypothetical protein
MKTPDGLRQVASIASGDLSKLREFEGTDQVTGCRSKGVHVGTAHVVLPSLAVTPPLDEEDLARLVFCLVQLVLDASGLLPHDGTERLLGLDQGFLVTGLGTNMGDDDEV